MTNEPRSDMPAMLASGVVLGVHRGWIRAIDVGSLVALLGLLIALALRLWPSAKGLGGWLAVVVLASYVAADFVSGMFHWMGDTWGTPETPVVGKVFVRPFREHHVDPLAITRHDFIEVNGGNCLISLPIATAAHFIPFGPGAPRLTLLAAFLCTFLVWVFATNQFHKWAHAAEPPPLARLLQRWSVILRPEHHRIHHAAPYDRYYCITTGWLNEPLQRLRLFAALEQVVSRMAGWRPHYTTASGHGPA